MVEGLEQLIELQVLDDELFALEQEAAGLPQRRAELAARREACEAERATAKAGLDEVEAAQRKAETDVQDKQALLEKLEGQQFQVKSNEAYSALLREIEQAKEGISEGETRILEALEAIDAARERLAEAEKRAAATEAGVSEQERALDAREKELGARTEELRAAREQARSGIERDLLAQYERIGSRRRPAVARVQSEMCLGCRVHLPPQLVIELKRGERLITCTSCARILIPA